jgi:hypothetical protein
VGVYEQFGVRQYKIAAEIIFMDSRRNRQFVVLQSVQGIVRDTSVKILGVSSTDNQLIHYVAEMSVPVRISSSTG